MKYEKDPERYIVVKNAHPAIIFREDFEAVQALMKAK
ncbi:recombinase family protein [Bacillus paralicheniformis]